MSIRDAIRFRITHMSLQVKQMIVTVICFIPLLVFILVSSWLVTSESRKQGLEILKNATDATVETLDSEMRMVYKNMVMLLRDSNIRLLLQSEIDTNNVQTSLLDAKKQAAAFIDLLASSSMTDDTQIYVKEDKDFLLDNNYFFAEQTVRDTQWYKDLLSGSQKGKWYVSMKNGRKKTDMEAVGGAFSIGQEIIPEEIFYASRAVKTDDYAQTEAVLKINYAIGHIEQLLRGNLLLQDSYSSLMNDDNEAVMLVSNIEERPIEVLSMENVGKGLTETEDGHFYIYRAYSDYMGWNVATVISSNSFHVVKNLNDYLLLIISLLISYGVIICFSTAYSKRLVNRIKTVSKHVARMQERDELEQLPPFSSKDELQDLADSFNRLGLELKQNLQREYQLGIAKRSSDLRALQSQINPHFLYNTLELIDYYAYDNQPEVVETIVRKLASFYKLSLNNGSAVYSLWKEIRMVTDYFDIQSIRLEGKINLILEIPEELEQCQIPPITLQPIVENSILHGIRERKNREGTVRIHAEKEENRVVISVTDDGVGMKPETVDELNSEMDMTSEVMVSGNHYGIQNINQRLKIMFGRQYGIHVESRENEGTTVSVTIPAS